MSDARTDFFSSSAPAAAQDARTAFFDSAAPKDDDSPGIATTALKDVAAPFTNAFHTAQAVGEAGLSSLSGGVASLADAVTGSDPGAHSNWIYKPRTASGQSLVAATGAVENMVGKGYDKLAGTGPLAQTLKERVPEFVNAAGTVLGAKGAIDTTADALPAAWRGKPSPSPAPVAAPVPELALAPAAARPAPSDLGSAEPPTAPGAQFADDTKAAAKPESTPAVAARAQVLQKVGLTQARTSALTNNGPAAMSEFQTSKDPTTPQGLAADNVFKSERGALNDFSNQIISKTGGSAGTDGAMLEARGGVILKPFDDLNDWFDAQRKAAYADADERAQGVPTDLKGFQGELADASNLTNSDRVGLKSGLSAYLNKLGVVDDNGNVTASVQQAETIRKYLNENWSPQNSRFVGKLKDAIDDDVTQAAGDDVYKQARAVVQLQKNTMENPKGIASILDASGPGGINRKVPVGQVADKITNMPPAQMQHIVTTLKNMPEALQPQAQAAMSELQSHFASRLSEVGNKFDGPWNHRGVNQFLDANSARAPILFGAGSPALSDMSTLRAAGNILRVDRSYPGAMIQGRILQSKLLPGAIAGAGTLIGETVGHGLGMPGVGGTVGAAAGGTIGARMAARANAKAMNQRMTKLSDLMKEPQ